MPAKSKVCTKCGKRKKLECFEPKADMKDGKRSDCRQCRKAAVSLWRKNNPDKARSQYERARAKRRTARREYDRRRTARLYADSPRYRASKRAYSALHYFTNPRYSNGF